MAIFARRSGSINLQGLLEQIRVDSVPNDGDILVWHEESQSFIIARPEKISGITEVDTFGGANVHTVQGKVVVDKLWFKEIKEGSGITITSDDQSLTITNSLSADTLSVAGSYELTIDNDADTTDARFEVFTAAVSVASPKFIDFLPTVNPLTVQNVFTENVSGQGVFKTVNGFSFTGAGFSPGQFLLVENAGDQSGRWTIDEVSTVVEGGDTISRIVLVQEFTGTAALNLGGPKIDVKFTQLDLNVPPPDVSLPSPYDPLKLYKMESVTHDFGPSGQNLLPGMIVHVSGSKDGIVDGAYVVASVVSKGPNPEDYSQVLFKPNSPIPAEGEGPVIPADTISPELRFSIEFFEGSTGFWVREDGLTHAPRFKADDTPTDSDDLTTKQYVDDNVSNARIKAAELYFIAFL